MCFSLVYIPLGPSHAMFHLLCTSVLPVLSGNLTELLGTQILLLPSPSQHSSLPANRCPLFASPAPPPTPLLRHLCLCSSPHLGLVLDAMLLPPWAFVQADSSARNSALSSPLPPSRSFLFVLVFFFNCCCDTTL